jgi:hypothetical protein
MSASSVQSPAARAAAPSQQATLDALVAVAVRQAEAKLPALATGFAALLADVSEPGLEAREIYRRVKSGKLLKENGYAFVHLTSTAIGTALREEIARLLPASGAARVAPGALSLVPLEEIDTRLAFAALARPFDIAYSEALATLAVRLGMLLGRGVLRADSHPFRPEVFLRAFDAAWREFEPDPDAHALAQGLLKSETLFAQFDLAPLYDAVIAALMRKEGQPGSVESYRIQKTDDSAAAKAARAAGRAALAEQLRKLFGDDGGEDGVPLIPDLPGLPTGSGGWRPSAAAGFVSAAAPGATPPATGAAPGPGLAAGPGQAGVMQAVPAAAGAMTAVPGTPPPAPGAVHSAAGAPHPAPGVAPSAPGAPQPIYGVTPGPAGAVHAASGVAGAAAGMAQPASAMVHAAGGFAVPAPASAPAQAAPGFAHVPAGAPDPAQAALNAMLAGLRPGVAAPLIELLAQIDPATLAGAPAAQAPADPGNAAGATGPAGGGAFAPAANVFYLPRLKQSLPKGALSRGDERTLDLLSRVFETVLLDDGIPARTRELLQLLQVPVLKAALLDKNFFFEEAHPARRLVDLLSRMGWDQRPDALDTDADADPTFQAMRRSVEKASSQDAAGDGKLAGFSAAVAELEASLAFEDSALERAIAVPVASAIKQENLAVATRAARDAVALRIDAAAGAGMIDVVSGFLEQRWTTVMTFAYSIEAQKPGAVGNAMRAMDDLIWSVKPKPTQEQRKSLIARLPRLLGTLNKWLDAIKWQDAERLQFFARLAECHASIVRAPIELSPERQLELAVEAAQQDALRQVELENAALDRAQAEQQAQREALSPLDGLERGVWLEFRNADGPRKVKLAWVSPLRTLFIFSGAGRREAFSLPADKLVEALHAGRARVLAIDGVVGQVLLEAMAQGAAEPASNDASMRAQQRAAQLL